MRAYRNTKGATLATLTIDYDFTCHLEHYTKVYDFCKGKLEARRGKPRPTNLMVNQYPGLRKR